MTVPLTIDTPRLALRQFADDDWKALQVASAVGAGLEAQIVFRGNPVHIYRHPASVSR
jgi:hypothetical protein